MLPDVFDEIGRDLLGPGRRAVSGATPSWSRDEPPAREEV